jgi:hypothetical protein
MKIKKSELKQIIQEELEQTLLGEGLAYRIFNALENFYVDIEDKIKGVSDEDPRRAYALKRREADKFCTKVARISDLHGDAHNKCTAQILDDWKREEEGETSEERSARKMAAMRADLEAERDAERDAEAAAAAQADADTLRMPTMSRRQARASARRSDDAATAAAGQVDRSWKHERDVEARRRGGEEVEDRIRRQQRAADKKRAEQGYRTDLQKSRGRGTGGYTTSGLTESADLYGIVLEELNAVLAEMKD